VIEADGGIHDANRFEDARDTERGELPGQHGLRAGCWNERLRGEIVHFVGLSLVDSGD
jgi:very-short-patch-repair endonuclease